MKTRKKNTITTVDVKALRQTRAFGIERRRGIGERGRLEVCGGEEGGAWLCRRRSDHRLVGGRAHGVGHRHGTLGGKSRLERRSQAVKASHMGQRDGFGFLS